MAENSVELHNTGQLKHRCVLIDTAYRKTIIIKATIIFVE